MTRTNSVSGTREPGLLRALSSKARALARETIWYLVHKVTGSSYLDYYARRMDRIVSRNPDWGLSIDRRYQLQYLLSHGLTPSMTVLDYGCGALAAGVLFIEHLDPSRYYGVDISSKALEEGRNRIREHGLEEKHPRLIHLTAISLEGLKGVHFDVIWAQSVFTHMPPADIRAALTEFRKLMGRECRLYATYAWSPNRHVQKRYKDWYYNFAYFSDLARDVGFVVEEMTDWQHPADPACVDRMLRFRITA